MSIEDQRATKMATASPFEFLHVVEKLKNTLRRGWVIRGIPSPESVSDHMYRMAIMVLMVPGVCLFPLSEVIVY